MIPAISPSLPKASQPPLQSTNRLRIVANLVKGVGLFTLASLAFFFFMPAAAQAAPSNVSTSLTTPCMPPHLSLYPQRPLPHPLFTPLDIPPTVAAAHTLCDYYEGEETSFEIHAQNAEAFRHFLTDLSLSSQKPPKGCLSYKKMQKLCDDVLEGRAKTIRIESTFLSKDQIKTDLHTEETHPFPNTPSLPAYRTQINLLSFTHYQKRASSAPTPVPRFGYPIYILEYIHPVKVDPDPVSEEERTQFLDATTYLDKEVAKPHFFEQSEEEILNTLLKTHETMMQGQPDAKAGTFREGVNIIVYHLSEIDESLQIKINNEAKIDFPAIIRKQGGSEKDVAAYKQSVRKAKKNNWGEGELWDHLTPEEHKAWTYIGRIAPSYHVLETHLKTFAKELKAIYHQMQRKNTMNLVALAAFAHQRLVQIHPFFDGNGRMARSLMNAILQLAKYPPLIFINDEQYNAVVSDDMGENPGCFANYIAQGLDWAQKELSKTV